MVYALSAAGDIPTSSLLYSRDSVNRPHQLRFGDVNMDGNPDVLVTVKNTNGSTKTWVLYNSLVGTSKSLRALGTSKPDDMEYDLNVIIGDSGSYYGTFFDFDEIG